VTDLPIHAVLPDLLAALDAGPNAVLVAPPGAGKTTAVAPALLDRPWCTGRVILLSPRRIAARAAAERIAELAGEAVGGRIGYATRLDSRQSAATRLLVVTQGIFVSMVQSDPELAGISGVLFDEVHERSLDGDFGLALALDVQAALRPDLRLLAMSATLAGERFSALLGGAPLIESQGRSYPIDYRYLGRSAGRIEDDMAAAIRRALGETNGGVLAFLPGVAEIERTAERIEGLPADVVLHRLYGTLDPATQRAAIRAEAPGQRKIVIATAIAETSLTIDGVTTVVDSGLARRPRYDRAAGITRLATERVSQAAATQRAGRAGRQAPGVAYRLWEAAATAGLAPYDPPEISEADLSALVLACAIWGVTDPGTLRWMDPPSAAAVSEAKRRLTSFGLIDDEGRPTAHGKKVAALPVAPRLGHMLVEGAERGWGRTAAEIAVLLSEQGLGGTEPDLEVRLRRWRSERGKRTESARKLAERWERMAAPAIDRRPRTERSVPASRWAFPIVSRRSAAATGRIGHRPAGVASGSIPHRHWHAPSGWPSRKRKGRRPVRGSCRLRRSIRPRSRCCSPIGSRPSTSSPSIPRPGRSARCASGGWGRSGSRVVPIPMPIPPPSPPGWWRACGHTGSTCCRGATAPLLCVSAPAMSGESLPICPTRPCSRNSMRGCRLWSRGAASSPTYPAAR
jgi:ATP-dependent helicase HrpB